MSRQTLFLIQAFVTNPKGTNLWLNEARHARTNDPELLLLLLSNRVPRPFIPTLSGRNKDSRNTLLYPIVRSYKANPRNCKSLNILECGKRLDQWDFSLFYCPLLSLLANLSLKLRRFFTLFPDFLRTRPTGSRTSSTTTGSPLASRLSPEPSISSWISCGEKFLSCECTSVTTSSVTSSVGSSGADWLTETTFVVMNTSCCSREEEKWRKTETLTSFYDSLSVAKGIVSISYKTGQVLQWQRSCENTTSIVHALPLDIKVLC